MKLLGFRFCYVGEQDAALGLAKIMMGLGFAPHDIFSKSQEALHVDSDFAGAIFESEDPSWIEIWAETAEVPKGIMLQLIVEDADLVAELARQNGLAPQGPVDTGTERVFYLVTASGLPISFQSRLR